MDTVLEEGSANDRVAVDGFGCKFDLLQNFLNSFSLVFVCLGGDEEAEVNEFVVHSEEGICNFHGLFLIPWEGKRGIFNFVVF